MGSCLAHGIISQQVPVADAVAASAAFPLLLPQLNRSYTFQLPDGTEKTRTLLMTDGGVLYDNLGLSPLLPGRSRKYTEHVHDLDYIIAVDTGVGRTVKKSPNFLARKARAQFWDRTYTLPRWLPSTSPRASPIPRLTGRYIFIPWHEGCPHARRST